MKVEKPKMPMIQKVFYICSAIFLIGAFIYLGTKNYDEPKAKVTDQERFTMEYGIEQDNIFIYKNATDILELMNTSSGLIFMAFPENEWSSFYAAMINDVAKELKVKSIYYYNFYKDRLNHVRTYENIVDLLDGYVTVLDDGKSSIYAPTFVIVKNGEIIYYDNETSIMKKSNSIKEYWTNEKIKAKKEEISSAIKEYLGK